MSFFAESLFPILDCLAQLLAYVCWVPTIVAFVTLRVSSDIDRQFARLAKLSSISTPCLFAFYILYILSVPTASFSSIAFSFSITPSLLLASMIPFFGLAYGDDVISVEVNSFHSNRLSMGQRIKNKYFRSVALAFYDFFHVIVVFGGLFYLISTFLSNARRYDFGQISLQTSLVMSVFNLTLLAYSVYKYNKGIKKQMAEERSKEISTEEATAEFADEKVTKQDTNTA